MKHLDRLMLRAQDRSIPLAALFELTGRCNLDCGHCYLDIAHPPPEMSTAEAKRVVEELRRAGTMFLTLTGGEVLLRKDALEIAWHARRLGMALRIFTNATRVTREIAAEIAKLRPLAVEVSLYGSHGERHDSVTARRRTLRRTLRGLALLRRAGVNVGLKAPLLHSVTGEVEALFRFADRLGAKMSFDPFVTPRIDGDVSPLAWRAGTAELAQALSHPRLGVVGVAPTPPVDPDEIPCALARRTVKIAPNGDVYPCVTYPAPVGNVLERSFAELWAGGPLLDRLRAIRMRDLGECGSCSQSGYCGRCTAVALIEHGEERGPSRESCRVAEAMDLARAGGAAPSGRVHLRVIA